MGVWLDNHRRLICAAHSLTVSDLQAEDVAARYNIGQLQDCRMVWIVQDVLVEEKSDFNKSGACNIIDNQLF